MSGDRKPYPKIAVKRLGSPPPASLRFRHVNPSPAPAFTLEGLDPEMLMTAIRGAHIEPCLLSSHPLASSIARVSFPAVCLDFASLGPALYVTGEMPADCFTLIFVLQCPTKGWSFNFGVEHTDGYIGFFPPGAPLDAVTPEGYANATLTVPAAVFHAAIACHFPDLPDTILAHGAGVRIGPLAQARLRRQVAALQSALIHDRESFADGIALRLIENELLATFLAALRDGCSQLLPKPSLRTGGRLRRIRQARDFIAAHLHRPIYLEDLCAELHLTPRAVENLFHDLLGVNPLTYLRHQRLHGARRTLHQCAPSPGVVKQVALQWGFWHLGRFAGDYRDLFGESPSETLAGAPRGSAHDLTRQRLDDLARQRRNDLAGQCAHHLAWE